MKHIDPSLAEELATLVFAEDVVGLDGVWWEDDYNLSALSCPRGIISLAALPSFCIAVKFEQPQFDLTLSEQPPIAGSPRQQARFKQGQLLVIAVCGDRS